MSPSRLAARPWACPRSTDWPGGAAHQCAETPSTSSRSGPVTGFADCATVAAALDATGRWPDACLSRPHDALALATVWAVGDEERCGRRDGLARHTTTFSTGSGRDRSPTPVPRRSLCCNSPISPVTSARSSASSGSSAVGGRARRPPSSLRQSLCCGPPPDDPGARALAGVVQRAVRDGRARPDRHRPGRGHPFDGLTARAGSRVDGPLVTVIVPCFRPDAGLVTDPLPMAAQTHSNPRRSLLVPTTPRVPGMPRSSARRSRSTPGSEVIGCR